ALGGATGGGGTGGTSNGGGTGGGGAVSPPGPGGGAGATAGGSSDHGGGGGSRTSTSPGGAGPRDIVGMLSRLPPSVAEILKVGLQAMAADYHALFAGLRPDFASTMDAIQQTDLMIQGWGMRLLNPTKVQELIAAQDQLMVVLMNPYATA